MRRSIKAKTTGEKNQNEIRFWDVATHKERSAPFMCTTGRVSQIAVDPTGKTLALAGCGNDSMFSKEIEI
jgi:hypothetical protein